MINFLKKHNYCILFIWIGFVLAISFMEAPLKFTSNRVNLQTGVSIGRIVFKALNSVELCLLGIYTVLVIMNHNFIKNYSLYMLLLIVGIQTLILLPYLDERALAILNNEKVQESSIHLYYVLLEITKVGILFWLSIHQIKQLSKENYD